MDNKQRHTEVWDACLHIISQIVEPAQFKTWFSPIQAVSLVDSTLTLEVPSDFFRDYLEGAYLDILKMTLKREIGNDAKLVYRTRIVDKAKPMTLPASNGTVPANKPVSITTYSEAGSVSPIVYAGVKKYTIDSRLNPTYNFANLIEGECNKIGVTAGVNISLSPGTNPFNPLFLFGGPGLGKTHIAQAIGIAIKEKYPDLVVLYVTGNEFKTQFMDAIVVRNKLTDFLAYYMKIDVLIVDDIQDLLGAGTQNAFFNVFNHLHQNNKQLIFTSDRAPVDLQNFEERLLSRFKWGLSAELSKPDYQTRLAMLKSRSFREGVQMDDAVLEYLASHIKTNFRELEGSLISLIAHATLSHQPCTLELAEQVVGNIVGDERNDISINNVQDAVCDYFNITRELLVSQTRKRQIVQARQIAMYLSRNLVKNSSLATIGHEIGGKDHATVLHACSTVSDLMSTDKVFRQYVNDIEKILVPVAD